MSNARTIVEATDANQDVALIRTLADAFQDDPALCWIMPDAALRRERLPRLFGAVIDADRKAGMILAAPGSEAVTTWRAPGKNKPSLGEILSEAWPMIRTFGSTLGRAMAVQDAVIAHHPVPYDYWHLHYAAVAPEAQGKGWGGAAIRDGLARAAAMGKPAILETTKPTNVSIYLRLGFEIIDEWEVPKGGPKFWTMLKPL